VVVVVVVVVGGAVDVIAGAVVEVGAGLVVDVVGVAGPVVVDSPVPVPAHDPRTRTSAKVTSRCLIVEGRLLGRAAIEHRSSGRISWHPRKVSYLPAGP